MLRIAGVLLRQMDPSAWAIAAADLAVEIGEDIRYPDIVDERLDNANSALSTDAPVFIAEVLSPPPSRLISTSRQPNI